MATLLSIVTDAANMVGATAPTAVIGSTDGTAKRMLALIKAECSFLVRRFPWSALRREATITTVNGTASYALESDFHRMVDEAIWDATNYWQIKGSLTAQQWQFYKRATITQPVNRRRFRLMWDATSKAREVWIDPTPTGTATLYYEYVSTQYCQVTGGGALKSEWSVDTDVPLLDDNLITLGLRKRYLQARGLPHAGEEREYREALMRAIEQDRPASNVDLGGPRMEAFVLPEGNFTLS